MSKLSPIRRFLASLAGVALFLVGLVGLALCTGCASTMASYKEPVDPGISIATIQDSLHGVRMTHIDGKKLGPELANTIRIQPGMHEVVVEHFDVTSAQRSGVRTETIQIEVEPAHVYLIDGAHRNGKRYAWVLDESTHDVVAGKSPMRMREDVAQTEKVLSALKPATIEEPKQDDSIALRSK